MPQGFAFSPPTSVGRSTHLVSGPINWLEAPPVCVIQARELTGVMMSNRFWLTDEHMKRLKPFFPRSDDKPRVLARIELHDLHQSQWFSLVRCAA